MDNFLLTGRLCTNFAVDTKMSETQSLLKKNSLLGMTGKTHKND